VESWNITVHAECSSWGTCAALTAAKRSNVLPVLEIGLVVRAQLGVPRHGHHTGVAQPPIDFRATPGSGRLGTGHQKKATPDRADRNYRHLRTTGMGQPDFGTCRDLDTV
jgi:hypothetical protein